jgi:murein DD-endopeptidase MepM/ murein hydrolase activator NlpD
MILPRGLAVSLLLLPCAALANPMMKAEPTLLAPVNADCISSPFGPRVLPNHPLAGTYHYGVDLPAPEGAPIRAVAGGTIIRVQRKGPGGLEVLVQHSGFIGIYSHFGMVAPAIADGQRVLTAGEKIGVVGQSGVTYGMHVYFEMLMKGHAVDPAPFLGLKLCNGGVIRRASDMLAGDGKIPPTRHYAGLR